MKYVLYTSHRNPDDFRPGVLCNDKIVDLEFLFDRFEIKPARYMSLRHLIEEGQSALSAVLVESEIEKLVPDSEFISLDQITLKAPLFNTKKLILLAGNYSEHIREVGYKVPPSPQSISPQFFSKPPSTTILDPNANIPLPDNAIWFDWEVELAVVMGVGGKNIKEDQAMDHVCGYTILNDISERKFNTEMPERFIREKDPLFDWLHGKWFDGSAPMGPYLVTKELIPDPHNLNISLERNGIVEQEGSTADMIHKIPYLIHKLSQIMTIEPGDVISTGTLSGVGYSKGIKLQSGDELICKIEKIGELRNVVL